MREAVGRIYPTQTPQCEGDRDRELFGGLRPARDPFFAVSETARGYVWVDGGLVHQLTEGSLLRAYRPDARTRADAGPPLATLEVEVAGAVRSGCVVRDGGPDVPVGAKVAVHQLNGEDLRRAVAVDGDGAEPDALRARLAGTDVAQYVRLAPTGACAEFRVSFQNGGYEVRDARDQRRLEPVTGSDPDSAVADLRHVVRYRNALDLQNRAPHSELVGAVHIAVRALELDPATGDPRACEIEPTLGGEIHVANGQMIVLEVTNRGAVPLCFGVFDFSYDWSVTLLYSRRGEERALAPKSTLWVGLSRCRRDQLAPQLPKNVPEAVQVVKVFASVQPTDYDVLVQPALRAPGSSTRRTARAGFPSPLTQLMELAAQGAHTGERWDHHLRLRPTNGRPHKLSSES